MIVQILAALLVMSSSALMSIHTGVNSFATLFFACFCYFIGAAVEYKRFK